MNILHLLVLEDFNRRSFIERALNESMPEPRVIKAMMDGNDTLLAAWADAAGISRELADGLWRGESYPNYGGASRTVARDLSNAGHICRFLKSSGAFTAGKSDKVSSTAIENAVRYCTRNGMELDSAKKLVALTLGRQASTNRRRAGKVINRYAMVIPARLRAFCKWLNEQAEKSGSVTGSSGRWSTDGTGTVTLRHSFADIVFKLVPATHEWAFGWSTVKMGRDPDASPVVPRSEYGSQLAPGTRLGRHELGISALPGIDHDDTPPAKKGVQWKSKATRVHDMERKVLAGNKRMAAAPAIVKQDWLKQKFGSKWPDVEGRLLPMMNQKWREMTKDDWHEERGDGSVHPVTKDPSARAHVAMLPRVTVHHADTAAARDALYTSVDNHGYVDHTEAQTGLTHFGLESAEHAAEFAKDIQNNPEIKRHVRRVEVGGTYKHFAIPDESEVFKPRDTTATDLKHYGIDPEDHEDTDDLDADMDGFDDDEEPATDTSAPVKLPVARVARQAKIPAVTEEPPHDKRHNSPSRKKSSTVSAGKPSKDKAKAQDRPAGGTWKNGIHNPGRPKRR